ncbi:16040_t:CDS:2, partial [Funneliformis geosporum]
PFWDRAHDTELIIDICDGLRPSIGDIVAPEGYIELMKECWDPDPNKRPISRNIYNIAKIFPRVTNSVAMDLLSNKHATLNIINVQGKDRDESLPKIILDWSFMRFESKNQQVLECIGEEGRQGCYFSTSQQTHREASENQAGKRRKITWEFNHGFYNILR